MTRSLVKEVLIGRHTLDYLGGVEKTLTEAGVILGVTPDTLRQQIHAGKLRAEKRGRDWFVTEREVNRYRVEHRRGAKL